MSAGGTGQLDTSRQSTTCEMVFQQGFGRALSSDTEMEEGEKSSDIAKRKKLGKLNYKGFRATRCIRFHETCAVCFNIIKAACSDGLSGRACVILSFDFRLKSRAYAQTPPNYRKPLAISQSVSVFAAKTIVQAVCQNCGETAR